MAEAVSLHHGDCLKVLRTLPDCSVDAVVTDPPYGLAFMGKRWDYDVPSVEVWAECLRVLKPGGHLLAFAGTRTQHRMAVRIEDAGFEIRDMIAWVYGSGFPKSLDVSKAIDKRGGNPDLSSQIGAAIKSARQARGLSVSECDRMFCGGTTNWSWFEGRPVGQRAPTPDTFAKVAAAWPELASLAEAVAEAERDVVGQQRGTMLAVAPGQDNDRSATTLDITAPATPEAQQWSGWGTALKPALEPITVARKPLAGTVAANVLRWGTGGLNVDGCRVEGRWTTWRKRDGTVSEQNQDSHSVYGQGMGDVRNPEHPAGRWPANLIHDGSDEVVGLFPESRGSGPARTLHRGTRNDGWGMSDQPGDLRDAGTGSAARFFYCAKASKADRGDGNVHPTVKPTELMRYLCRLVTPPGGVVLDPFMGSGSTGKAAALEGFAFIGIEREAEYLGIAQTRIQGHARSRQLEIAP